MIRRSNLTNQGDASQASGGNRCKNQRPLLSEKTRSRSTSEEWCQNGTIP